MYWQVVNQFDDDRINFYIYKLKSLKGLLLITKDIGPEINPDDIKEEQLSQGFKVKAIPNAKSLCIGKFTEGFLIPANRRIAKP